MLNSRFLIGRTLSLSLSLSLLYSNVIRNDMLHDRVLKNMYFEPSAPLFSDTGLTDQGETIMKTRLFKFIENFTTKKMKIFR